MSVQQFRSAAFGGFNKQDVLNYIETTNREHAAAVESLKKSLRFNKKNILFIAQVAISIVIPILTYFGLQTSDLTTWGKVWETFIAAISNPYVVVMALMSLFNAITDPTTKGFGDSNKALTYEKPKED